MRRADPDQRSARTRTISITALLALIVGGALGGILSAAGDGAASSSAVAPATERQLLTLVAVPGKEAFVNNADDRTRGTGNNPFGNYGGSRVSSKNEQANGPFAGDEGIFEYTLYTDATRREQAGSALLICQYGFDKSSFCEASYRLAAGSLTGLGSFEARAGSFGLTITGGTGRYRGVKGSVQVAASPGVKRSGTPMLVLRTQRLAFALDATAARPKRLTQYSVTRKEQFIHNRDDETRGIAGNPFRMRGSAAVRAMKGRAPGPFAGDEALFTFDVYTASNLVEKAGSATFTCLYAFDNNAFCNASYSLDGGTVIGAGTLDFEAPKLPLAVTGGSGRYSGMTGDLEATPGANHSQRLAFELEAG